MKRIALTIATVFTLTFATNAWAEGATTGNNGEAGIESSSVRYVRAPRFVRPLVEKWISEYAKTHSGVEFRLASGPKVKNDISLDIIVEGGSDTKDWGRDKDEDEIEWIRRCLRQATNMVKPRKGKGLNR